MRILQFIRPKPTPSDKPVEVVYIGRRKAKPSVLTQFRLMVNSPVPEHDANKVKESLYPSRAA